MQTATMITLSPARLTLAQLRQIAREDVPHYAVDRCFPPDIAAIARLVQKGSIAKVAASAFRA